MNSIFSSFIRTVCKLSLRKPLLVFLLALIPTSAAVYKLKDISLDTNLIRLLPKTSRAAVWTKKLENVVGDGGYFTILLEGTDKETLERAVRITASRAARIKGVRSVEFQNPVDFYKHYRYILIPLDFLDKILDLFIQWESEVNPLTVNLLEEETDEEDFSAREDRKDIERMMDQYGNLPLFHRSKEGLIYGMIIRPEKGVTALGATKDLYARLDEVSRQTAAEYGIWTGVDGSLRNKINEYDLILSDLKRSGLITAVCIILVLVIGFRTFRVIPALLLPLLFGLTWAFGLVPWLVGNLNTITSFLLLVSFGLGIDFSIHLLKRFQRELQERSLEDALLTTFISTGKSIFVSGVTTALALLILAVSDFRGISEFGFVGGIALLMILLAMFLFMPSTLILGRRIGLVKALTVRKKQLPIPSPAVAVGLLVLFVVSIAIAALSLRFDYDFSSLKAKIPESQETKERQYKVYPSSMSPAAIFVTHDVATTDEVLHTLNLQKRSDHDTTIGWVRSFRDLAPDDEETQERLDLIEEIQEQVQGRWIERIEDPDRKRWIDDLRDWVPVDNAPRMSDLPRIFVDNFTARDGSGEFLVAIYPNVERKHGKNAMAFTQELYDLKLPESVRGPVGETPVFAEILWLVTSEGPWLTLLALLGVFLLVFVNQRSLIQSLWILLPLVAGVVLCFGVMGVAGMKLNFFNIVVIPTLLGMGVDGGVHYYRRWKESDEDTQLTQTELFSPLTVATVTTMLGYSGMVFARHPGLHSIGLLACLGLSCTWLTTLLLLPGLLNLIKQKRKG
jgi:predicted RND superfamily exporter protein